MNTTYDNYSDDRPRTTDSWENMLSCLESTEASLVAVYDDEEKFIELAAEISFCWLCEYNCELTGDAREAVASVLHLYSN